MSRLLYIKCLTLITLSSMEISGQGCSDAGFCSVSGLNSNVADTSTVLKNQVKFGASYGSADKAISVFGSYVEFHRVISPTVSLDGKITTLSQTGNSISTFGLSDVYLNANYKVKNTARLILGIKIPLSDGNKKKNKLSLPMDYQSSLGTLDLLLGMFYEIRKFQLSLALQQPLTQNKNEFFSEYFPEDSKLMSFQTTNNFNRSGDILCRVSRTIKISNKFSVTPGILSLYHLSNDSYEDIFGKEEDIEDSQGFTLNGNLFLDYIISEKTVIHLAVGAPFVIRNARPDGLTRSYVANLEYRIKF